MEIDSCSQLSTIFRGNQMASYGFKVYARIIGLPYLFHTIGYFIRQLAMIGNRKVGDERKSISKKNTLDLIDIDIEVDTNKLEDKELLEENKMQMIFICTKILNAIYKSLDEIPPQLRMLFKSIRDNIEEKFGDVDANSRYYAIGGLFFLRFFVPGLFLPHQYGLLEEEPPEAVARNLALVSKIVQSIGNIAIPGQKEPYLLFIKDFIEEHIQKVCEFYEHLMDYRGTQDVPPYEIPHEALLRARFELYKIFYKKAKQVKEIIERENPDESSKLRGQIDSVLLRYGHPPEVKKKKKDRKNTLQTE